MSVTTEGIREPEGHFFWETQKESGSERETVLEERKMMKLGFPNVSGCVRNASSMLRNWRCVVLA